MLAGRYPVLLFVVHRVVIPDSDSLLLSSISTAVFRARGPACLLDLAVLLRDLDRVLSRLSGAFLVREILDVGV